MQTTGTCKVNICTKYGAVLMFTCLFITSGSGEAGGGINKTSEAGSGRFLRTPEDISRGFFVENKSGILSQTVIEVFFVSKPNQSITTEHLLAILGWYEIFPRSALWNKTQQGLM